MLGRGILKSKVSKKTIWILGILVLIIGSIYFWYNPIKLSSDVIIPTEKGFWKQNLFIIEEPNKNLDSYLTSQTDIPPFYLDSIPGIKAEVQTYLEMRNRYIKGFLELMERDKKNPIEYRFFSINKNDQIIPVKSGDKDRILFVKSPNDTNGLTRLYLLNTDYLVLSQSIINHVFDRDTGSCVVSSQFMDRAWLQTWNIAATNGDLFINTISIENNQIRIKEVFAGNNYLEDNAFDRYKIVNPLTNPKIGVHKKGPFGILVYIFVLYPLILILLIVLFLVLPISYLACRKKRLQNESNSKEGDDN